MKVGIVGFSDFASIKQDKISNATDFSNAINTFKDENGNAVKIGATNVADGIWIGKYLLDQQSTSRSSIMVLITDGKDNLGNSVSSIEQIVKSMQTTRSSIAINTVSVGSDCNE